MKIAFLLPSNGISGGLFVAYRHAHFLAADGHDVTVAFVNDSNGLEVTAYPDFSLPTRSLAQLIEAHATFDVVLSGWWECYYEMFRLQADHYLHFIQGDDRDSLRAALGSAFADEAFVDLAFTDPLVGYLTVARWLKARLEKDAEVAVAYAPNGIDLARFRPDVAPLAARGGVTRVLIEGAGRLSFKRVDLAFQVTRQLSDIEVWHVASDGHVAPQWRCARRFCEVPMRDMPAIYASCDILLKLSVVEGFFGPPLEMMACGGTAVVTRVNGHEEYVRDGHNALTVPLDDGAAAVAAMRRLIHAPDLRRRLSHNGPGTAAQFGWEAQCPKFAAGLFELLKRVPRCTRRERAIRLAMAQWRRQPAATVNSAAPPRRSVLRLAKGAARRLLRPIPYAEPIARRLYRGLRQGSARLLAGMASRAEEAVSQAPLAQTQPSQCRSSIIRFPSRPLATLGPIAFVGQPEYFRAAYFDGIASGEHFEYAIDSRTPGDRLRDLPLFARQFGVRTCLVFRPEMLADCPGLVERLQGEGVRVVGYSTEPTPSSARGPRHPDLTRRLESLCRALPLPLDLLIHFLPDAERFLRGLGFQRLICHPLPVSKSLFYPEDLPINFDACFLGRSTPYREQLLGPLKSQMSVVHVAHGLVDEEARTLMNRSAVVLNLHNEPYANFETRAVQALFCGRPVVSERLSGPWLHPGRDYHLAETADELLLAVRRMIQSPRPRACPPLGEFSLDALLAHVAEALGSTAAARQAA